jgi:ankyrin repeat protein
MFRHEQSAVPEARRRITEVWSDSANGSFGTGYLLGGGLVLTARHVVMPEGSTPPTIIKARPLGIAHQVQGLQGVDLIWPDIEQLSDPTAPDAALLRLRDFIDTNDAGPQLGPPNEDGEGRGTRVSATGFPAFVPLVGQRRDTEEIAGVVFLGTTLVAGRYQIKDMTVRDREKVNQELDWHGMSGAALLSDSRVIGILIARKSIGQRYDFSAVRTETLLAIPAFSAAIHGRVISDEGRSKALLSNQPVDYNTLGMAISSGQSEMVRSLLKAGLSPNWKIDGNTPLHLELHTPGLNLDVRVAVLKAIIGAAEAPRDLGAVAHAAMENGSIDHVIALLRAGTPIDVKDANEQSLSTRAMRADEQAPAHDQKWVELLAKEWIAGTDLMTTRLLIWSAAIGNRRVIEALLNRRVNIDSKLTGHQPNEKILEGELRYWWPGGTALHFSIGTSIAVARRLIGNGSQINLVDREGATPLHWAVRKDKPDFIRLLVQAGASIDTRDNAGQSPLQLARTASIKSVKELVANKELGDVEDASILLHGAVYDRNFEIVEILLQAGANPNKPYQNCPSTLFVLGYWGEPLSWRLSRARRCLELLISHGAHINLRTEGGESPLHYFAQNWGQEEVKQLLDAGAEIDAVNFTGQTPLMFARSREVAEFLIAAGASSERRDKFGYNPVDWTTMWRIDELLELYSSSVPGATKNAKLIAAIHSGNMDNVQTQLSDGAGSDAVDGYGTPAIHIAARQLLSEIVKTLIDSGADINTLSPQGRTPLAECLSSVDGARSKWDDYERTLRLFLDRGASRVRVDRLGNDAVFYGYAWWHIEDLSTDILTTQCDSRSSRGETALMMAVQRGSVDQVRLLISMGVPLDDSDARGRTAMHWALEYNTSNLEDAVAKATLLLEAGASVAAIDEGGESPIFLATKSREPRLVSLLIDWGADVDATNKAGETPIFAAVKSDASEVIFLLLQAGASAEHIDGQGLSLREVALRSRRLELLNQFLDARWNGR